jgi:hypothetical protein
VRHIRFGPMSESPRILEDAIKAALEAGCTCINGGEFHGTSECKSPVVFNGCFEIYLENATKVPLSIRGEKARMYFNHRVCLHSSRTQQPDLLTTVPRYGNLRHRLLDGHLNSIDDLDPKGFRKVFLRVQERAFQT